MDEGKEAKQTRQARDVFFLCQRIQRTGMVYMALARYKMDSGRAIRLLARDLGRGTIESVLQDAQTVSF